MRKESARQNWLRRFMPAFALIVNAGPLIAAPSSPLPPSEERSAFQFADTGLTIELAAAEPNVISPVAITWDADGRMFVAEMIDYPTGPTAGQIRMLEDLDGDGTYEKATLFADKLPFPNGVLPWNGGLLVTSAPDIWYLKDTDGDGRADERRVLFTGFAQGNQQLRVNGLMWGLDNWVYGANGRSDGEIRRPTAPGTNTISIRRRDFRFRPDTGEFEAIAGASQFGLTRDDWGNRFLSWNTIPIRHAVLEERYLSRNPNLPATESVLNILPPDDTGQVFPLTPSPLVFNSESSSHFNALAGLAIYRGDALGMRYRGNAFVGESLRNLVHRRVLEPNGVTFVARRGEENKEFLASNDPWFHPVNFATGPDGALYIVDFYRQFVEHPQWIPESLRDKPPWRKGAEYGRIWRVRAGAQNPSLQTSKQLSQAQSLTIAPRLQSAKTADLVKHLANSNAWWRDTAQRLLLERHDRSAIPLLRKGVRQSGSANSLARLHALWTLQGLKALDQGTLSAVLRDGTPAIREHAVRLAESALSNSIIISGRDRPNRTGQTNEREERTGLSPSERKKLLKELLRLVDDSDARVRFQLALTLGEVEPAPKLLARLAAKGVNDPWQAVAIFSSLGESPWLFLKEILHQNRGWLSQTTQPQGRFLQQAAELVGAKNDPEGIADFFSYLRDARPATASVPLLAGFFDGLSRGQRASVQGAAQLPVTKPELEMLLLLKLESAATVALSDQEAPVFRLAAIRVLAHSPPSRAGAPLLRLLLPNHSAAIQSAATTALVELNDRQQAIAMFSNWSKYSTARRRQVMTTSLRSDVAVEALLDSLENGKVQTVEVDAASRQRLRQMTNAGMKARAERILKTRAAPERDEVVNAFQPALKLVGSPARGGAVFVKACYNCHSILGQGGRVGPDLSGVASRPKEALLADILDPNRLIAPDFLNFRATTAGGEVLSGLIANETSTSITLRRLGEPDIALARREITALQAEGISPMPEGLEQGLSHQDVADLIEFLRQPDKQFLPESQ
jgi:putative membrane-bound dehydrogenase-like protein